MSKLPTPAKLGLLTAAVLLVLVGGWFLVLQPKRSEATRVQKQIDDVEAQIQATEASLSHPQGAVAPAIRVADLFRLSRAMPDQADIPGILLQLSRVADETGVEFESITPHDPSPLGSYERVPIDLVFEGRFYDLSDFLYRLRNLVSVRQGVLNATGRLFSVDAISFDQGALQFPHVKATLTISAYVFGDGTGSSNPATASGSSETTTPATESSHPIPPAPAGATAAGA
jgi:type IV pilus assembly protein PilO